jgi:two-component system NtrC family sensor kinase
MERKKKYYTTLTKRLLIIFFFLSVLPIASVGLGTKEKLEQNNIIKVKEIALSTIEHRAEVISSFLKDKTDLLRMLVSLYSEEYFFIPENLEKLFLAVSPKGDIVDLQVIDATGIQHAYVGPYHAMIEGKKYDAAPWFQETLISGVHISDVFTGFRNVPHFVVAVTDPLKKYVLRATINSSIFNSLLLSAQLSPGGDAFIVNRTGEFQTPSLQGHTSLTEEEKRLISFDSPKGSLVTASYVYTTRWIGDNRWLMIVKANIEDSLGQYYYIRNHILILVVIVSIIAMTAATIASFSISRHLERADREHAALSNQFAQMEKMATIGRLAAGIAHEINNPLQMITNQAGWVGELLPDEDPTHLKNYSEYVTAVEQIKHHVRRAGTITHRLLGFSRKMNDQQEKVNINDTIEETVTLVEKEAEYNNIAIIRELDAALPKTMTDGPQLQQVFLNLINNAIDAIGQQGEIVISTEVAGNGNLVIDFSDTGPGIPPENLEHLFDPFFTTKDVGKGTGLGLYISYDIIKKLGGTLSVKNGKTRGAVFTITLPVKTFSSVKQ